MHRCLFVLGVVGTALCGSVVMAQTADTLMSADCRRALGALQAQEAAVAAARRTDAPIDDRYQRGIDPRLAGLRRQAAQACLGGRGDPPPPSQHLAQPPISVPPVTVARPALPPAPTLVVPPVSLPRPAERPTVVTGCDAIGCWANDGSRLLRVGPDLRGPRGLCSVQGNLLNCP